jgi:hypothetical protein
MTTTTCIIMMLIESDNLMCLVKISVYNKLGAHRSKQTVLTNI